MLYCYSKTLLDHLFNMSFPEGTNVISFTSQKSEGCNLTNCLHKTQWMTYIWVKHVINIGKKCIHRQTCNFSVLQFINSKIINFFHCIVTLLLYFIFFLCNPIFHGLLRSKRYSKILTRTQCRYLLSNKWWSDIVLIERICNTILLTIASFQIYYQKICIYPNPNNK